MLQPAAHEGDLARDVLSIGHIADVELVLHVGLALLYAVGVPIRLVHRHFPGPSLAHFLLAGEVAHQVLLVQQQLSADLREGGHFRPHDRLAVLLPITCPEGNLSAPDDGLDVCDLMHRPGVVLILRNCLELVVQVLLEELGLQERHLRDEGRVRDYRLEGLPGLVEGRANELFLSHHLWGE